MIIRKIINIMVLASCFLAVDALALELLDDEHLSDVTGQASLFTTDYIAPGGSNPNTNIGFYKMGLNAEISINTNIHSLRLGCDGPDGTGICDINLNNVRLAGLGSSSATDSGPGTDAILTQPFFEFAIRNPGTAASREVVGIRFGAAKAIGRMTIGENPNPANNSDDTGITSFSGDMNAQIINASMTNICANLLGICLAATATLDDYNYANLHGGNPLVFQRSQVNGCGSADFPTAVNCMYFDGLVAHASLFGLTLDSRLTEGLNYIHDLGIEDGTGNPVADLSMSLQKEAIKWQKVSTGSFTGVTPAQKGWWISIPNVVVRNLQINDLINTDALGALFGQTVTIQNVDLGQLPADNCYGSLTFC